MTGSNSQPAVRLDNVSKRYGRRWALARLSVEIPVGSAVLLTGENGAGKTTLLRILGTAMRATYGQVTLFGRDATTALDELRPRINLITHHNYLYEDLSADENLRVVQRLLARGTDEERTTSLERVGLARHAHRPVRTFSAGMKRRLCLARMFLREPELVLLDEPFGQLDPAGVTLMEEVIREQRAAGRTLVIATHDIDRGKALCDLHLELEGGRARGTPKAVVL